VSLFFHYKYKKHARGSFTNAVPLNLFLRGRYCLTVIYALSVLYAFVLVPLSGRTVSVAFCSCFKKGAVMQTNPEKLRRILGRVFFSFLFNGEVS
jgi:hypothetical protein